jgi:hypothetical protein
LEEIAVVFDGEEARVTDFVTVKEAMEGEGTVKSENAEDV